MPTHMTPASNQDCRLACSGSTPPVGIKRMPGNSGLMALTKPGPKLLPGNNFTNGAPAFSATAISDAVVLEMGHHDLQTWLSSTPAVAEHLLQALARRLRRTNEALADLVFSDVPGRVAKALLDLSSRFGRPVDDGIRVAHDLTQEELAQLVGASRETVNKALADFAARGWVRREGRAVVLLDVERLERRSR